MVGPGFFWPAAVRAACRLYPRDFRQTLATDMAGLFTEEYHRVCRDDSLLGSWLYGAWSVLSIIREALRARLQERTGWVLRGTGRGAPSRQGGNTVDRVRSDVRHAARRLRKSAGFTLAALATLGVGIGGNAAIFSLVNAVVIQPLPFPDASRLVRVRHAAPGIAGPPHSDMSVGTFLHYREHNETFEDIALYHEALVNITGDGPPARVELVLVTPSFFSIFAAAPSLGTTFTEADGLPGAATVVMLSNGLWRRRFGGDPGIIGRSVEVNGVPRTIIGVMPPAFAFPSVESELWMNMPIDPSEARVQDLWDVGIGRLRPGTTSADATADLRRLVRTLEDRFPDVSGRTIADWGLQPTVIPLKDAVVGDVANALWILFATMGFVLIIACANVANLFLVRTEHRHREFAIRRALGASRIDLARYVLSESILITSAGAVLGVVIAYVGSKSLVLHGPVNIPRLHEVRVDAWVMGFATVLALLSVAVLAATGRTRTRVRNLSLALKDGSRTASAAPNRQRARRVLVASQVALAMNLLVGAALMVRSYWKLSRVEPGFDSENVLTFQLTLLFRQYRDYRTATTFFSELLIRVRNLPGVEAAGAVTQLPLQPRAFTDVTYAIEIGEGSAREAAVNPLVSMKLVTDGYFETMGITIVEGDPFAQSHVNDRNPVFMTQSLATRLIPGRSPIGERVRRAGDPDLPWATVRGITADVRSDGIDRPPSDLLYVPVLDHPVDPGFVPSAMTVVVRSTIPTTTLMPSVRAIVWELDPELPISGVSTMRDIVSASTARGTFTMLLLLVAAAIALFLGVVGLYGVLSYAVGQRAHEIGVRLALGAGSGDVRRMIVGQGIAMTGFGVLAGLIAAWQLTRFLQSLLFDVSATDVPTFVAVAVLLLSVAAMASYLPARRAAGLDPVASLRAE